MNATSIDTLKGYARQENNHILSLHFNPPPYKGEDPLQLAERNVGATERSFGANDILHVMALDTYGYLLTQQSQPELAKTTLQKALELCRQYGHEKTELFAQTQMLFIQANIAAGLAPSAAITKTIAPSTHDAKQQPAKAAEFINARLVNAPLSTIVAKAAEYMNARLVNATFSTRLTELLLIMSLADVSRQLLEEIGDTDPKATANLTNQLALYFDIYYGQADDDEEIDEDDDDNEDDEDIEHEEK